MELAEFVRLPCVTSVRDLLFVRSFGLIRRIFKSGGKDKSSRRLLGVCVASHPCVGDGFVPQYGYGGCATCTPAHYQGACEGPRYAGECRFKNVRYNERKCALSAARTSVGPRWSYVNHSNTKNPAIKPTPGGWSGSVYICMHTYIYNMQLQI